MTKSRHLESGWQSNYNFSSHLQKQTSFDRAEKSRGQIGVRMDDGIERHVSDTLH